MSRLPALPRSDSRRIDREGDIAAAGGAEQRLEVAEETLMSELPAVPSSVSSSLTKTLTSGLPVVPSTRVEDGVARDG